MGKKRSKSRDFAGGEDRTARIEIQFEPLTPMQTVLQDAILGETPVIIAHGGAGTGKTFTVCSLALDMLFKKKYRKIVVCRPVVESESRAIGFLAGSLERKLSPFTRSITDVLETYASREQIRKLMNDGAIEVVHFGHLRGRSFNNTIIVLDEAQNTSKMQMQLLLNRIGEGTKVVVVGDPLQCDRSPNEQLNGLSDLIQRVGADDKFFKLVHLPQTSGGIVRHNILERVREMYEEGGDYPRSV